MSIKQLPPRVGVPVPARDRVLAGDAIIVSGQRIPIRLLKDHGVTHVVAKATPAGDFESFVYTITGCRGQSNVPWSRTSRFNRSKIDCMGCLVALGRI